MQMKLRKIQPYTMQGTEYSKKFQNKSLTGNKKRPSKSEDP